MTTNLFDPDYLITNLQVPEEYTDETKNEEFLFPINNCDGFFEIIQGWIKETESAGKNIEDNNLSIFNDLPECQTVLRTVNILGEYYPCPKSIKYYKQNPRELEITKIHERFHAVHHLALDGNNQIWKCFANVDSFYLELLAQLFTYIHIRDKKPELMDDFLDLNRNQPLIYQTFKMFRHYNQFEAEKLYWMIRKNDQSNPIYEVVQQMANKLNLKVTKGKTIDDAVFEGIRKTINRFREQPFLYFTESDIHASLSKDIMDGHSDILVLGNTSGSRKTIKTPVSLVHHEYPTNFRYDNKKLKSSGYSESEMELTDINKAHGDRGNFDLVVLNKSFVEDLFVQHQNNLMEALLHIINKDINLTRTRNTSEEIDFAIEVKFIHPFNAGNKQMETEVKKDNNKLHLALQTSDNFIKPINLIFCNSNYVQSNNNSVIKNIKDILEKETPVGVCSIFIESYFCNNKKNTDKPKLAFKPVANDLNWINNLKAHINCDDF
jgi:hypothetical protein